MAGGLIRSGAALALAALAACTVPPVDAPPAAPPPSAPPPPSAESRALAAHYGRVERELRGQGLLRTDAGAADAPFTARELANSFVRIALFDEYVSESGRLVARPSESELRRWEQPIRMRLIFGDGVPEARRARDRAEVARYAQRLSSLTGVPIRLTDQNPNFDILILNEDERRKSGALLRKTVPDISATAIGAVVGMPKSTFCLVFAFSDGASSVYTRAVAVIRDEHPPLLRTSCIHEELAQSMGLANDSPTARPSIFNDDEEFAFLTRHDELLLRMLYDRRLRPGMRAAEARPIALRIATEMVGGGS